MESESSPLSKCDGFSEFEDNSDVTTTVDALEASLQTLFATTMVSGKQRASLEDGSMYRARCITMSVQVQGGKRSIPES